MEEHKSHSENIGKQPLGNTKSRGWCLTINNPKHDYELSLGHFDKWIRGREHSSSGTPHLQMWVYKKTHVSFSKMKKLFPEAHIEKAKGSAKQNLKYCSKEGDYDTFGVDFAPAVVDHFDMEIASPWQIEILDLIENTPSQRAIHWYWSEVGGIGKTTLCKHLCLKHGAILVSGAPSHVKCAIADRVKDGKPPKIVLWNIPRTGGSISYTALEHVKDGIFFSEKYESGMCLYNEPHIIVFANWPPLESALSADRWVIKKIGEA